MDPTPLALRPERACRHALLRGRFSLTTLALCSLTLSVNGGCGDDGNASPGSDAADASVPDTGAETQAGDGTDTGAETQAGDATDTSPDAPLSGRLLAEGTIGSEGGVLVVDAPAEHAGIELRVAPGALAEPRFFELRELTRLSDAELPLPLVVLHSNLPLPTTGVSVAFARRERAGIPPELQGLYGLGLGTPGFVELVPAPGKADESDEELVATLLDLYQAGEDAVTEGRRLISDGIDRARSATLRAFDAVTDVEAALAYRTGVILFAAHDVMARLFQPNTLFAPPGSDLETFLCGGGKRLLLVHGITSSHALFETLQLFLESDGWEVAAYDYPSSDHIDSNARRLVAMLDKATAGRDIEPITVVAHSMGGLVTRAAIQDHGAGRWIDRVVMIGTPHGGGDNTTWLPLVGKLLAPRLTSFLELTLPGLTDLYQGSDFLAALNVETRYRVLFDDGYYQISGWAKGEGEEASDGWTELVSGLALTLSPTHESYFSAGSGGEAQHHFDPGVPEDTSWLGAPSEHFEHSALHAEIVTNGVGPTLLAILNDEARCSCDNRSCGQDGCGNPCGPPCCGAPIDDQYVTLVFDTAAVGVRAEGRSLSSPHVTDLLPSLPDAPDALTSLTCSANGRHVLFGAGSVGQLARVHVYRDDGEVESIELPVEQATMPVMSDSGELIAWLEQGPTEYLSVVAMLHRSTGSVSRIGLPERADVISFDPEGRQLAATLLGTSLVPLFVPAALASERVRGAWLVDIASEAALPLHDREIRATGESGPVAALVTLGRAAFDSNGRIVAIDDEQLLFEMKHQIEDPDYPMDPAVVPEIHRLTPGSTPSRPLTHASARAGMAVLQAPSPSPSSSRILFWQTNEGDMDRELRLLERGSGQSRVLAKGPWISYWACWLAPGDDAR